MNDQPYKLTDLTPDEAKALTKELQDVLAKYDCEIGITSNMTIMKRIPAVKGEDVKGDAVLSPIQINGSDNGTGSNNSATAPA